jgi:hypothetical protein
MSDSNETLPTIPDRKARRFSHRRPDPAYLEKIGMVDGLAASAITGKSQQTLTRIGLPAVKLGRTRLYRLSDLDALLHGEPLPPRKTVRIRNVKSSIRGGGLS